MRDKAAPAGKEKVGLPTALSLKDDVQVFLDSMIILCHDCRTDLTNVPAVAIGGMYFCYECWNGGF